MSKQKSSWIRKVLLVLVSVVGLCALMYGYIAAASLWGRESIQVDGVERSYRVYVPTSYVGTTPAPMVLIFHMYSGSGKTMEWITHFNEVAEQNGFIAVYPDGYKMSWAEGSNLYAADQEQINDITFVSALINKLEGQFALDTARIYATGFSSGGIMVQRLGCELSDRIAAIATVGAVLTKNVLKNCAAENPMSVLMINGVDDHGVPWEGDSDYSSVPATVAYWVENNECDNVSDKSQDPDIADDGTRVEHETYTNCLGNTTVTLYSISGSGHTWPGGNQPAQLWGLLAGKISRDIDASVVVWKFFEGQSR